MSIKKCINCGGNNFYIEEVLIHKAGIDENGILEAYKNFSNEIESITCADCGQEHKIGEFIGEFEDIQFNY